MPHPGRPTSTLRRRTRTRHRSPPRTGSALSQLTNSPTRTGPHVVRQRLMAGVAVAAFVPAELRPDHRVAAGTLTPAELPARDLGHGRLPVSCLPFSAVSHAGIGSRSPAGFSDQCRWKLLVTAGPAELSPATPPDSRSRYAAQERQQQGHSRVAPGPEPLGSGEFNRDVADAQVSPTVRHAPGPGEQRQRCAVACSTTVRSRLTAAWASAASTPSRCCADAASLPVVGDGDGDVGGGPIIGVLQEMGSPTGPSSPSGGNTISKRAM